MDQAAADGVAAETAPAAGEVPTEIGLPAGTDSPASEAAPGDTAPAGDASDGDGEAAAIVTAPPVVSGSGADPEVVAALGRIGDGAAAAVSGEAAAAEAGKTAEHDVAAASASAAVDADAEAEDTEDAGADKGAGANAAGADGTVLASVVAAAGDGGPAPSGAEPGVLEEAGDASTGAAAGAHADPVRVSGGANHAGTAQKPDAAGAPDLPKNVPGDATRGAEQPQSSGRAPVGGSEAGADSQKTEARDGAGGTGSPAIATHVAASGNGPAVAGGDGRRGEGRHGQAAHTERFDGAGQGVDADGVSDGGPEADEDGLTTLRSRDPGTGPAVAGRLTGGAASPAAGHTVPTSHTHAGTPGAGAEQPARFAGDGEMTGLTSQATSTQPQAAGSSGIATGPTLADVARAAGTMARVEQAMEAGVDRVLAGRLRDDGQMHLALRSEGLGELDIRVAVRESGVHASIAAQHDDARHLLNSQRADLEAALQRYNLRLDSFSVDVGGHDSRSGMRQEDAQGSFAHRAGLPSDDDGPRDVPLPTRPNPHRAGGLSVRA